MMQYSSLGIYRVLPDSSMAGILACYFILSAVFLLLVM
jgi:hypothetical protein